MVRVSPRAWLAKYVANQPNDHQLRQQAVQICFQQVSDKGVGLKIASAAQQKKFRHSCEICRWNAKRKISKTELHPKKQIKKNWMDTVNKNGRIFLKNELNVNIDW